MRQGQQNNKRMRGRGGGGGGRKPSNPLQRSYESNGPDVKIRGNALHVAEKYVQLARDASSAGDRVAEQSYLQHAEHYYRIVTAAQAQMPQPQPQPAPRNEENSEGDNDQSGGRDRGNGEPTAEGNTAGDRSNPIVEPRQSETGPSEAQTTSNGSDTNGRADDIQTDAAPDESAAEVSPAPPSTPRRPRRSSRSRGPREETRPVAEDAVPQAEE
jgi:hypothetical protein